MEVNQVYDAFQESKFLNNILSPGNLLFIGEAESISYLKSYAVKHQLEKSNYCYSWQEDKQQKFVSKLQNLKQCRGIVVASIQDESTMFNKINSLLADADLEMPVLKLFDDLFVNFMAQTNLLQSSDCNFRKPTVSYGILTLPRSGSTFLCHLLAATEVAGYPTEHLRTPSFTLAKYCNFDYIRFFQTILTHRVSLNGVFGTKFISHFLRDFETLETGLKTILNSIDKYIYLVRKDEVAQAISILLAQKTKVWHINNQHKMLNYQDELESIVIDDELLNEVKQKLYFIRQQQKYIDQVFKTYQISPLVIEYENLVENVEDNIHKILDYLEINTLPGTIEDIEYSIKKMSSDLSLSIAEIYRAKYGIKC